MTRTSYQLKKDGNEVNLQKHLGLQEVNLNAGWTPAIVGNKIDLDISVLTVDKNDKGIECVFYQNLVGENSSIVHSGDDRGGDDEGEGPSGIDESIHIKLPELKPEVKTILLVINSYSGHVFEKIIEAFVSVSNPMEDDKELMYYDLDAEFGSSSTLVIGKVTRNEDNTWSFQAIGQEIESFEKLLMAYQIPFTAN